LNAIAHVGMDHPGPWARYLRARGYTLPDEENFVLWQREAGPDYEDGAPHPKPWTIRAEDNDTSWHVDQAINYLSEKQGDPWILHLSLLRPHPPWIASEPWNRRYDPERLPELMRLESCELESAQHPWLRRQLNHPLYRAPDEPKKLNRMRAVYFGMMSEVDHHLGRLFEYLRQEGLWDETLIIFTSDHGEQLGDHWMLGKSGYFDQSYFVPMIIRDPSASADPQRGSIVSKFSEHVDIVPTLLEFAGADVPPQCDGHSLLAFTRGLDCRGWRTAAHIEYDFRDASFDGAETELGLTLHQCNLAIIRDEHYKYVHFAGLAPLLFDLRSDPGEFRNIAADEKAVPIVVRYTQSLLSWRQAHEDQTLTHMMATSKGLVSRPSKRT
jgi:arylsulfatase A-like enzyme